jgi:hypothetical protein
VQPAAFFKLGIIDVVETIGDPTFPIIPQSSPHFGDFDVA